MEGFLIKRKISGLFPQASALGRAGQWSLVLELVKDMEMYGVSPTEVVLRAAADCCSKVYRMRSSLHAYQS